MTEPWLPYDVARCHGEDNLQCLDCLRRTAPGNPHRQSYLIGVIVDGKCGSRITQQKETENDK